jgi:hypothetical protein
MNQKHSSERGQALVLIVLAIVGVFGFSALAIDGGMLYAERRRAQNAADTSVFAAAMAGLDKKTETEISNVGLTQASMNGFYNDSLNSVAVYHPPVAPWSPAKYIGDKEYYMVVIKTQFKPFFAQFVYSGLLENTVWAIAKAKPSDNSSPGNAIFSTGAHKCHGVWFAGNADSTITGGHIYSSSDRPGDDPNCASGKNQGSAAIDINLGSIKTVGGFNGATGIGFDPGYGYMPGVALEEPPNISPPSCSSTADMPMPNITWNSLPKGDKTIQPGIYDRIDIGSQDIVTMERGLYCLDGDLTVNAGGNLNGMAGVMVYMRGSKNDPSSVAINGGATVNLHSITGTTLTDANGKEWSGMLIYMDYDNTGTVELTGNGSTTYYGTVYAPGPTTKDYQNTTNKDAKCSVSGTGDSLNLRAQLICYSVNFTGDARINITFNEEELYHDPPHVELAQ